MTIEHYRDHVANLGKECGRMHRLFLETQSETHRAAWVKAQRAWTNAKHYLKRREKELAR